MHKFEMTVADGLMLYRCLNERCGEEASVPAAGSAAWHRHPQPSVRNFILQDGRLRSLEVSPVCPAAPHGLDPLRKLARRRHKARYGVRTLQPV